MATDQKSDEIVVQQLTELFAGHLTPEVISKVARACDFDIQKSSNQLLEISQHTVVESNPTIRIHATQLTTKFTPTAELPKAMQPNKRKTKKAIEIDNALSYINKGYKVLVLLRGLPGSGKSTLAKNILENTIGLSKDTISNHVFSTDDFFMKNGKYCHDSDKLNEAHNWNQRRAFNAMSKGYSPVIIDNTNTEMWEMKAYAHMATDYGYFLEILEPDTHWCFNENELAKRNTHGVSKPHIRSMIARFERNISPAKLLNAYSIKYILQKPPQFRSVPPFDKINLQNNIRKSQSMSAMSEQHSISPKKPIQFKVKPVSANRVELTNGEQHPALRINPFAALTQSTNPANFKNLVKSQSFAAGISNGLDIKSQRDRKHGPKDSFDGEVIDLMDFEDTNSNNSSSTNASESHQNHRAKNNPVDNLLMCGSPMKSNVLSPVVQNFNKKPENNQKSVFGDISAWGVDEKALRSWDIVTPIEDADQEEEKQPFILIEDDEKLVDTNEFGTNTDEDDFSILRNLNSPELRNIKDLELTNFQVLDTLSRDINRNTPIRSRGISKKLMLEKGCMTEEVLNEESCIDELLALFPNVPRTHVAYWLKKCKGDMVWTIELLLASKEEALNVEMTDDEADEMEQLNQIVISQTLDSDSDRNSPVDNEPFKVKANKKKRKSPPTTEESLSLKKTIEQKFDISSEHYSEHLLKVKYQRFGSQSSDSKNSVETSDSHRPSTSKAASSQSSQSYVKTKNRFEGLDDMDLDQNSEDSNSDNEDNNAGTIEINLGDQFVEQLERHFGDRMPKYPKGFMPVVQIPERLGEQLFAFYLESVFSQLEAQQSVLDEMTKEDQEIARKLQAEEYRNLHQAVPDSEPETFKDIMKEQGELAKWQKEADKWKLMTPDTLSAKMTREKLFGAFPSLPKDTLVEILHAHDNVYKDTVETLFASCNKEDYVGEADVIKQPPLEDEVLEEITDAHSKYKDQEFKEEKQTADQYREEAQRYYQRRKDLYDKANSYNQRGMTEVAMFYSGLARQQTVYFEMANARAAQAFLNQHEKRINDFRTLDFHFLFVREALPTLDVFLDRSINLLRSTGGHAEILHLITGRGKNSEGGVSKIKPTVEARLRKRKIIYQHLNPGLLKVRVTNRHLLTDEMEYTDRHT